MRTMSKKAALAAFTLLVLGGAASAQDLNLPPSQAQLNAQTQATLNNQLLQTQLQNLQTQQSIQQNEIRQQQLFNSLPAPGYLQNQNSAQFPKPPGQ